MAKRKNANMPISQPERRIYHFNLPEYVHKLVPLLVTAFILYGCGNFMAWMGGSDRFIVVFDNQVDFSLIVDDLEAEGIKILDRLDIISGVSCHLNEVQQEFIYSLPFVRYVEKDLELYMLESEFSEPLFTKDHNRTFAVETIDWGVRRIKAHEAWATTTGRGVRVGVIDTGINSRHPDLKSAVAGGYNAIDGGSYEDDNNHGTYVASVIAGRRNGVGIVGVAPEAELYSIKVMGNKGSGYISDVIEGCQWALEEGIRILNMSLGSKHESIALCETMSIIASKGVITTVATGNDGQRSIYYPARNEATIRVGGSGTDDRRASWSNYGDELKENGVLAPGDWIQVANKDGGWQRVSGTSIATPHVTGIVALLVSKKGLERELVRKFILEGASNFENPDEFCGYGIVNAKRSLDLVPQ